MRIILIAAASVLASAALAQTSPPPNDKQNANAVGGDWRKTWKLGPDRYAFEGMAGGCHYSGTVTPSGYHYDRSC